MVTVILWNNDNDPVNVYLDGELIGNEIASIVEKCLLKNTESFKMVDIYIYDTDFSEEFSEEDHETLCGLFSYNETLSKEEVDCIMKRDWKSLLDLIKNSDK